MKEVPLSDEKNYAILTDTFGDSLRNLDDKSRQVAVLKRIYALVDSNHPKHFIYETPTGTDTLQIIRAGDALRIYCRLVMGVPEQNTMNNVLYCFYADPHRYDQGDLSRFDTVAKARMKTLKGYDRPGDVREYLEENGAFSADELKERIDRA